MLKPDLFHQHRQPRVEVVVEELGEGAHQSHHHRREPETAAEQSCETDLFGLLGLGDAVGHRHTGLLGDGPRLVELTPGHQPRHGLGHLEKRQRQQGEDRQRPDHEQSAPSDGIQEKNGEQSAEQASQRHAGIGDGAAEVLLSRRGDLGDQGGGGSDQCADTEAGEEAHHTERCGGAHQRGDEHADGEPRVGDEHDLAATEDVTEGSGEQGAEHHSQQGIAAQGPRHRGRDLPDLARVFQERRHHCAIDDEVVAIEDQADGGEGHDPHHRSSASCILTVEVADLVADDYIHNVDSLRF